MGRSNVWNRRANFLRNVGSYGASDGAIASKVLSLSAEQNNSCKSSEKASGWIYTFLFVKNEKSCLFNMLMAFAGCRHIESVPIVVIQVKFKYHRGH